MQKAIYPKGRVYIDEDELDDLDIESYLDINDFCKKIAGIFFKGNENAVISPLNIYIALSVLAEITDGDSRNQILSLLGEKDIDSLRDKVNDLWLLNYCDDEYGSTVLANSLWIDEKFNYNKETGKVLTKNYFADIYDGNFKLKKFTNLLKKWLNDKTKGLLNDYVSNIKFDENTVMAIYSSIYFKAAWENTFDAEYNDMKIFHSVSGDIKTEFMNGSFGGLYYKNNDFSAVTLRLENDNCMWVVLPNMNKSLTDIISDEKYFDLCKENTLSECKYLSINCSVPKFDISSETNLINGLAELGIKDVFDYDKSDFSSFSDEKELFVNKINHAARVKIDEEGVIGAAYTEMEMIITGLPPQENVDFICDRPFLFMITSGVGSPLFIGKVNTIE